MELRRIHVFDSRQAAFRDVGVLQENIIFHAVRGQKQPLKMVISSSSGEHGDIVAETTFPFVEIVHPHDIENLSTFLRLPATRRPK